ncbi:PAS domain S-box protein [Desulfosporosinus sp. Sb-LF]|uniref:PAS domain S-box protein n=1 Tax=Desulfosporosinus sp. Sb-LF TaxID=2560027 RepID=UPI0018EE87D0|nr:PAS domain S-box protein [Desulfosporosinus sp. Sb-LF]
MYYQFIINVIVVLFLCGVVTFLDLSFNRKYSRYILGIMFGLITIFTMTGKIMVIEGRFYDFRHITMTMAGFAGGPVTAIIAAMISSLYRYNVGGSGSMGGITNILVFACFGSILGRRVKSSQNGKKVLFWFIVGIVMAFILIFIIAFIPPWKSDSVKVLRIVAGPFLIITPLATTIIFNFYFWIYEFLGKASILNTIINFSPINLMIFDTNGPILLSKNLKRQQGLSSNIENSILLDTDKTWPNGENQQFRYITTEDGRHFATDLSSFQMPSGTSACLAIINDVTERKWEQEMFRGAKERFAKAFQLGPHMMTIIRKSDYRYVDVNRRFLEARGFAYEDAIGKTPIELGVSGSEFKRIIKTLEERGSVQNLECALFTKYGSKGSVILSAETIHVDDQECILFAYNDVTEMKRMQTERVEQLTKHLELEAELSKSNQLIADLIDNMPDGFYALDNQWRFTFINKKAEELMLKTREELLGKVLWEVIPETRGSLLKPNYQKAKNDCVSITFENPSLFLRDTWYQVTVYPSQIGLSVYYRDITEQKLSREKLTKSQEETASILESMTDCFFAMDRNWQITYVNRAGEIAFGNSRDELLGRNFTEVFEINDTSQLHFHEVMNEKRSVNFEIISELLGNKWLEISLYPSETGLTCYFRDITSRKIAENEIARLDRLNLVGQLAAGIGHEIRNPMTTVRGYLQLLGEKPDYAAQKSTFALMISELDRANSIITEFLSLARTKQTELKSQNLNDILNNLYPLLEADTFTQNKQIRFIPGEIFNLKLNGKEISQLVLNLARNGLEAMKERGSLTIKSYVEDDKVVLAIEDEGCGIPLENLNKLGTPFFTTKDSGTGLGLATCYKIAESHNAKIHIDSSAKGTTFLIFFPIPKQDQNEIIA